MSQFFTNLKTEFHKSRNIIFVLFVFFMAATFSFFATGHTDQSSAASLNDFNPGNIISDAVMANYTSMSLDDIQRFLTSKNPCNNTDYRQYLISSSTYPEVTWHWSGEPYNGHFVCISEERFGEGNTIGSGQTAAEIIYGAAQEYKINPQVLIVLLEKEQGLITDTLPHSGQYRAATGYGCPDTAACDSKYYGLKNQVYNAAWLFRYTLDHGYYAYPEKTKGVYIAYNPNSSCGRSEVYIENRATSALYRYTPYQPNAAALAAGSGYGDGCSAYGNRNFYLFFTRWFGSTQASVEGELASIAEGVYDLSPKNKFSGSMEIGNTGLVRIAERVSSASSRWYVSRVDSGTYTFKNMTSGRYLTSDQGNNQLSATSYQNSCTQRWKVYKTPDSYFTLESTCEPGTVIDVPKANEANVRLGVATNNDTQKWSLLSGYTITDGVYIVHAHKDQRYVMDVAGASKSNSATTQIYEDNATLAQKWRFTYSPAGDYYTITNPVTGKALDVDGGVLQDTSRIQMYSSNYTCAQRWKVLESGDGRHMLLSACSTDKMAGVTVASNESKLKLANYSNNTQTIYWDFDPISTLDEDKTYAISSIIPASTPPISITVDAGRTADCTNIHAWEYVAGAASQFWRLKYDPKTGTYEFINPNSGKALDVSGASMQDWANINLYSRNSTCAQKWYIYEDGENQYSILSSCNSNFAVDLTGASAKNNTNIHLWTYGSANDAQKWVFTEL